MKLAFYGKRQGSWMRLIARQEIHSSRRRTSLAAFLAIAACAGTGATGDAPAGPRSAPFLSSIALSGSPNTIQVGQTATARAHYYDQYGATIAPGPVTWSATPPGIVAVSSDGAVTGLAPGPVIVAVTAGRQSGFWSATVLGVPVAAVVLTPNAVTLDIGLSRQLEVALRDAAGRALGDDRAVSWSSSDTTRVSVSPEGRVTAISPGVARVTATSEGIADSALVTVSTLVAPVARVALVPAAATIAPGQTLQLTVWLTNATGDTISGRKPAWSSSAPDVVAVSGDGVVTAVAAGVAAISASIDGQTATANVAVSDDVIVSVDLPDSVTIYEDTLPIVSHVTTKHGTAGVVANVPDSPAGSFGVPLVLTPEYNRIGTFVGYSWRARMPVKYLGTGTYHLLIRATDSLGTQGSAGASFKHHYSGGGSALGGGHQK